MPLQSQPSSDATTTFAGLLAALTAPKVPPRSGLDDLFDGFEEDVATLSYERALQTHSRYKAADPVDSREASAHGGGAPARSPVGAAPAAAAEERAGKRAGSKQTDPEAGLKRASVTLRMSRAECARMQKLAAEAGLTVSAYLRFCAFEVESLRSQVKAALAEMRPPQADPAPSPGPRWLRFFWPHA